MNISLKIVLIFWLVGAATAQDPPEGSGMDPTDTPAPKPDPCDPSPCIGDSRCEKRNNDTFVCICRPGLEYTDIGCIARKVFPGSLKFSGDFKQEMADKTSSLFKTTAEKIEDQLYIALQGNGYIRSVVLSLRSGSIIAEVQNIYELTSNATTKTVEEQINKAIADGTIDESPEFIASSLCNSGTCDRATTKCSEQDGLANCKCMDGYIMLEFISQACRACPIGQRAVDSKKCEKCPFGFAGFNCSDSYLLVLVVVSTVLGAFLIIIIGALIVVSCRNQKESSSPKVDFSSNYGNTELHKPTGIPRIPRANPDASWKSNSLEMTNSVSNQALVTRDRPESKTRYSDYEDVSYRGQVPPAYSGYGGRGMENGGVQNPYFQPDDDRMRRY